MSEVVRIISGVQVEGWRLGKIDVWRGVDVFGFEKGTVRGCAKT